jgi:hypothetical protein
LEKLKALWSGVAQAVMQNPQAWVVETIKSTEI